MHPSRDHLLPPDPDAYRRASHPRGRVIVIAPTRAACETIELALALRLDTVLEREHGRELREWAAAGKPFGIVAGTGVGKTLGIRPIAESMLEEPLRVGVVNREREATPETPSWNVVIVTTGIARRWFEDDLITGRDTIVVDEIHQTSAELELCLALGKRAGCRFIWLSATVDPTFYARYLDSAEVLVTHAFDPRLKARVKVLPQKPGEFLDDRFMRHVIKERRGVAVFVPTRAEVEQLATALGEQWRRLTTAFYHGGEPIRVIRPFLEGEVEHPWLLAMTAAGQSALNLRGLDTVVIYDARYGNVVDRGRNVLHRLYLGANEILQMAGRVHGRVAGGEVFILSDRDLVFEELRPGPPEFQLAGDAERVAITCAALGVDATELDLPVPLDRIAYRRALALLTSRGLVENGKLTAYGRQVEAMPVDRPWGELLVHADAELVPVVAVCSNIDSLHRMTREERDLHGAVVSGSDHLTAYNLYAEAVNQHGRLGEVYGLPRHLFEEDGGHRAGHRVGLSLTRAPAAAHPPACVARPPAPLGGAGRPDHAVRPRHRRAHCRGPGGAGLQDICRGKLGRSGRKPAVLRRQVRDPARRDRGDDPALRSHQRTCDLGTSVGPGGRPAEAPAPRGLTGTDLLRLRAGDRDRGAGRRDPAGVARVGARRTRRRGPRR
jgi:ATP-dependent helicase HrpA